jgi:hypothetical protein
MDSLTTSSHFAIIISSKVWNSTLLNLTQKIEVGSSSLEAWVKLGFIKLRKASLPKISNRAHTKD